MNLLRLVRPDLRFRANKSGSICIDLEEVEFIDIHNVNFPNGGYLIPIRVLCAMGIAKLVDGNKK